MSLRTSSVGGGIVYKLLKNSPVDSLITGGIYRRQRPADSKKEDVVVRARTINADSAQKQYIDILAYVPDIQTRKDTFEPDIIRLGQISAALVAALHKKYTQAYSLLVQETEDENKADGINFHFVFIRLYFIILEPIEL